MLIIKCRDDLKKARLPTHIAQFAEKILTGILRSIPAYNPDDDGYIVIVSPRDMDADLCAKLGARYSDNVWEGVNLNTEHRCFHAVYMTNNQFTVSVLVPSDQNIDPAVIARMVREAA